MYHSKTLGVNLEKVLFSHYETVNKSNYKKTIYGILKIVKIVETLFREWFKKINKNYEGRSMKYVLTILLSPQKIMVLMI